jgi:hypothetical protein
MHSELLINSFVVSYGRLLINLTFGQILIPNHSMKKIAFFLMAASFVAVSCTQPAEETTETPMEEQVEETPAEEATEEAAVEATTEEAAEATEENTAQ